MSRKRQRKLGSEERRIWEAVTRTVTPLNRRVAVPSPEPDTSSPEGELAKSSPAPFSVGASVTPLSLKTLPPPPSVMARKERRAIVSGKVQIDAKIDLHGLRQNEAHTVLRSFLVRAAASGHRTVLVVTGKGAPMDELASHWPMDGTARGVLRRITPMLLESPSFRDVVLGFEPADQRHGGAGALYVRLRRRG